MTAFGITCTVIPQMQDDTWLERFLIIAPEDKMVWVAAWKLRSATDSTRQEQRGAIAGTSAGTPFGGLNTEDTGGGDILKLSDRQLDCRSRNLGRCRDFPASSAASCDCRGFEIQEDDCFSDVIECWLLEEAAD